MFGFLSGAFNAAWTESTIVPIVHTPAKGVESALLRARALAKTLPDRKNATTRGGEAEDHEWWITHRALLEQARLELGPLHSDLYDLEAHAEEYIQEPIRKAVERCEDAARTGGQVPEEIIEELLQPAGAPGVWRLPLFTPRFCTLLLEELAHYEQSGIPMRRPNGMNRFGAILDELGLSSSLDHLCRRYLRPLGQMLYPWLIADGDADEHYGFVVRYKKGEDVSLAEHADASVLTLNANLGYAGFSGGALAFRGTRGVDEQPKGVPASVVDFSTFSVGDAILHLGGQYANCHEELHAKPNCHATVPRSARGRMPPVAPRGDRPVVGMATTAGCHCFTALQAFAACRCTRHRKCCGCPPATSTFAPCHRLCAGTTQRCQSTAESE